MSKEVLTADEKKQQEDLARALLDIGIQVKNYIAYKAGAKLYKPAESLVRSQANFAVYCPAFFYELDQARQEGHISPKTYALTKVAVNFCIYEGLFGKSPAAPFLSAGIAIDACVEALFPNVILSLRELEQKNRADFYNDQIDIEDYQRRESAVETFLFFNNLRKCADKISSFLASATTPKKFPSSLETATAAEPRESSMTSTSSQSSHNNITHRIKPKEQKPMIGEISFYADSKIVGFRATNNSSGMNYTVGVQPPSGDLAPFITWGLKEKQHEEIVNLFGKEYKIKIFPGSARLRHGDNVDIFLYEKILKDSKGRYSWNQYQEAQRTELLVRSREVTSLDQNNARNIAYTMMTQKLQHQWEEACRNIESDLKAQNYKAAWKHVYYMKNQYPKHPSFFNLLADPIRAMMIQEALLHNEFSEARDISDKIFEASLKKEMQEMIDEYKRQPTSKKIMPNANEEDLIKIAEISDHLLASEIEKAREKAELIQNSQTKEMILFCFKSSPTSPPSKDVSSSLGAVISGLSFYHFNKRESKQPQLSCIKLFLYSNSFWRTENLIKRLFFRQFTHISSRLNIIFMSASLGALAFNYSHREKQRKSGKNQCNDMPTLGSRHNR